MNSIESLKVMVMKSTLAFLSHNFRQNFLMLVISLLLAGAILSPVDVGASVSKLEQTIESYLYPAMTIDGGGGDDAEAAPVEKVRLKSVHHNFEMHIFPAKYVDDTGGQRNETMWL